MQRVCRLFKNFIRDKKIAINKMDNKLSINFITEYILKSYPIEIDLFPKKIILI